MFENTERRDEWEILGIQSGERIRNSEKDNQEYKRKINESNDRIIGNTIGFESTSERKMGISISKWKFGSNTTRDTRE